MDNCPLICGDYLHENEFHHPRPHLANSVRMRLERSRRPAAPIRPSSDSSSSGKQSMELEIEPSYDNNNSSSNNNRRRTSLFKALTTRRGQSSRNGSSKHTRLNEDWMNGNEDPSIRGVTFYVKFLGSALTDKAGSSEATEATKTVIQMVKAGKKTSRVGMTVSPSGIVIVDESSGEITSEISIYDIAHCSMDGTYPTVFTFIATNKNETNECYCFASDKRKMAQKATLTIAEAFNVAYELWQNSTGEKTGQSPASKKGANEATWVHFEDADEGMGPVSGQNEYPTQSDHHPKSIPPPHLHHHHHQEDLLICFH